MENNSYKETGKELAKLLFVCFDPVFSAESFYNALEMKRWFGEQIKGYFLGGYRNLTYREYKAVCDVLYNKEQYHIGIDFGAQAIHVTLGPEDVYSLYFRNPSVSE
jgi:hypothetical protein